MKPSHCLISLLVTLLAASPIAADEVAPHGTDHTLTRDGVTYHYRRLGAEGSNPSLIMLTRYRANMDDWDPAFLAALARHRQVIVFNQQGVASTGGEPRSSIPAMAEDVAAFIRGLGAQPVDVLGWSMGGFTAQALIADEPTLVRRVVLIGTGPAGSATSPAPKPGVFEVATQDARADGITTYSDQDRRYLFFAPTAYSAELAAESLARIDRARRPGEPLTTPAVREAQTAAIQAWWLDDTNPYFAKMTEVRQPVLIVNGDRDAFFSNQAQALMMSRYQNSSLAIYPQAGHGPHHQHPAEVAALIDRFLR